MTIIRYCVGIIVSLLLIPTLMLGALIGSVRYKCPGRSLDG